MILQFHGAARTVTGSMHIVKVNGVNLVLDCGLYQGKRKLAFERNRTFPIPPGEVHNVILSHAHIDHSGNLPRFARGGFRGRIICTQATRDLCEWMLRDSAHIQVKDVEHVNKIRGKNRLTLFEPLYTLEDAEECLELFEGIPYDHEVTVAPGVKLIFRDAGHMLGSAITHLEVSEAGRTTRLVFTGDVGRRNVPILRDPVPPVEAHVLISESTYGDRLHETPGDVKAKLRDVVTSTHARGGKILVPAFSVGRTQTLVYYLNLLYMERAVPPMPVFVDSPLSTNVTDVFRAHPECYDVETLGFLEDRLDPFGFSRLTYIRDVEASKALNDLRTPCIIISASGMMESGRVLHHLKNLAPDGRNTILIVGFMAEHTLGRRVVERPPAIKVFGEEYPLRAQVAEVSGLSGHADRDELTKFFGRLETPPRHTFLVHGEEPQARSFAEHLRRRGFPSVEVPEPGARYTVS
ncbi:MAG TPA: MBL fold metallo-hydrolase [Planctomycetota bacterium]|nr:MBL fold metallo-hydrolase [Planctomycetota bacterium]